MQGPYHSFIHSPTPVRPYRCSNLNSHLYDHASCFHLRFLSRDAAIFSKTVF